MKYQVKWNNGFWKLFDTNTYNDVDFFWLKKDADEAAHWANKE